MPEETRRIRLEGHETRVMMTADHGPTPPQSPDEPLHVKKSSSTKGEIKTLSSEIYELTRTNTSLYEKKTVVTEHHETRSTADETHEFRGALPLLQPSSDHAVGMPAEEPAVARPEMSENASFIRVWEAPATTRVADIEAGTGRTPPVEVESRPDYRGISRPSDLGEGAPVESDSPVAPRHHRSGLRCKVSPPRAARPPPILTGITSSI